MTSHNYRHSDFVDTIRLLVIEGECDPMVSDFEYGSNSVLRFAFYSPTINWILLQDTFTIDASYKARDGKTALHIAARSFGYNWDQNREMGGVVRELVKAGADVHALEGRRRTPMDMMLNGIRYRDKE